MAVENVDSEDGLLRLEDWDEGRKKEELLGKHLDCLFNVRCGSMKKIHKVEAIYERNRICSVEQSRGEVRGSLDVVTHSRYS
jgi:hypothetical protein